MSVRVITGMGYMGSTKPETEQEVGGITFAIQKNRFATLVGEEHFNSQGRPRLLLQFFYGSTEPINTHTSLG
jgi:hypothetical protein